MSKRLFTLVLAVLLAISLTACQGGQTDQAPEGDSSAGQTDGGTESTTAPDESRGTVVIAMLSAQPEQMVLRTKYIEEPMIAAFPDAEIKFEVFTDRQSLQVQVAGGGGPDILDLDGPTDAVEFAKAGRIVDLTPYASQYGWEDLFFDWAYNSSFYDGKLYSLPNSFEGMVMYYNVDVFTEHGWSYPTTAAELLEVMDAAQEAGIIPISFGNSDYQGAVDWLYSTFLSCYAGPDILKDALEGGRGWDDPQITESIQQMVDWWQTGYIGDKKSQAITNDDMVALFAEGKAAMMIDGTWVSPQLLSVHPECNWDVELMPELRPGVGRVLPLATGGCYVINESAEYKDLAVEALNWLFTSTDRHMESVREASYQPYPVTTFNLNDLDGMDPRDVDMYGVLIEAQETGNVGFCSWTFFPSDARIYMNEQTDALFLGTLDTESYLSQVQTYVTQALEDGSAPVLP